MLVNNPSLLYEPIKYNLLYTFLGFLFLLFAALGVYLVFYVTRKKKIKVISDLKPELVKIPDLSELRKKYLKMVDEVEMNFNSKKLKASLAHQKLSLIVRYFYSEAAGFHAEIFTLSDLKKSKMKNLTKVINFYYPDEFNQLEKGSVSTAVNLARLLIHNTEVLNNYLKLKKSREKKK